MIVPEQSKLEPVFRRVKCNCSRARGTVQAVSGLALDAREINRIVECAYHPIIASMVGNEVNVSVRDGNAMTYP